MAEFHQIAFDAVEEAAAFVAALSRQLAAPRSDLIGAGPLEVSIAVRESGADVYLTPSALASAERAFGAVPSSNKVVDLPSGTVPFIRDSVGTYLSRDDVLRALAREPTEPRVHRLPGGN